RRRRARPRSGEVARLAAQSRGRRRCQGDVQARRRLRGGVRHRERRGARRPVVRPRPQGGGHGDTMMKARSQVRGVALLAAILFAAPAAAAKLNPPFDLPQPVKSDGKQTSCEAPPPPVRQFSAESVYEPGDETHSTIDPEAKARYDKAIAPLR